MNTPTRLRLYFRAADKGCPWGCQATVRPSLAVGCRRRHSGQWAAVTTAASFAHKGRPIRPLRGGWSRPVPSAGAGAAGWHRAIHVGRIIVVQAAGGQGGIAAGQNQFHRLLRRRRQVFVLMLFSQLRLGEYVLCGGESGTEGRPHLRQLHAQGPLGHVGRARRRQQPRPLRLAGGQFHARLPRILPSLPRLLLRGNQLHARAAQLVPLALHLRRQAVRPRKKPPLPRALGSVCHHRRSWLPRPVVEHLHGALAGLHRQHAVVAPLPSGGVVAVRGEDHVLVLHDASGGKLHRAAPPVALVPPQVRRLLRVPRP
mmetsp:Transcript_10092/g.30198  ORF Transcript_10092/g.30198 Transcript_10092/m.30198 type:complete len:314 (+) Transcript_10092:496-1437(+)